MWTKDLTLSMLLLNVFYYGNSWPLSSLDYIEDRYKAQSESRSVIWAVSLEQWIFMCFVTEMKHQLTAPTNKQHNA